MLVEVNGSYINTEKVEVINVMPSHMENRQDLRIHFSSKETVGFYGLSDEDTKEMVAKLISAFDA